MEEFCCSWVFLFIFLSMCNCHGQSKRFFCSHAWAIQNKIMLLICCIFQWMQQPFKTSQVLLTYIKLCKKYRKKYNFKGNHGFVMWCEAVAFAVIRSFHNSSLISCCLCWNTGKVVGLSAALLVFMIKSWCVVTFVSCDFLPLRSFLT